MDNKKIGKFIAQKRKELNLNQKELAEKLNITDKAVSKWETGRSTPDVSLLIPLSNILGVSVTELLYGENLNQDELSTVADEIIVESMKPRKSIPLAIIFIAYILVFFKNVFTMLYDANVFGEQINNFLNDAIFKNSGAFSSIFKSVPILIVLCLLMILICGKQISKKSTYLSAIKIIPTSCYALLFFMGSGFSNGSKISIVIIEVIISMMLILSLKRDLKLQSRSFIEDYIVILKKIGAITVNTLFSLSMIYFSVFSLNGVFRFLPNTDFLNALFTEETILLPIILGITFLIIVAISTMIFFRNEFSKITTILFSCGFLLLPLQFILLILEPSISFMYENEVLSFIYFTVIGVMWLGYLIATEIFFWRDYEDFDFI